MMLHQTLSFGITSMSYTLYLVFSIPLVIFLVSGLLRAILIVQVILCLPKNFKVAPFLLSSAFSSGNYPREVFSNNSHFLIIKDVKKAKQLDKIFYWSFMALVIGFIAVLSMMILIKSI